MTHTPGPWRIRNANYNGRPALYIDPGNERGPHDSICVAVMRETWPWSETEANARLIAAAPTLLAALQSVLRVAEGADLPGPVYLSITERNALRAAIAQATGEEA